MKRLTSAFLAIAALSQPTVQGGVNSTPAAVASELQVGQRCVVEATVIGVSDHDGSIVMICRDNFFVVIPPPSRPDFEQSGIGDLRTRFKGNVIQVSGKMATFPLKNRSTGVVNQLPCIEVALLDQMKLIASR